jgi:WD40 repeat protein
LRNRRGRHPRPVEQAAGSAQRSAISARPGSAEAPDWDAFVSYAHADGELVHRVVDHLEAAGWSIWLDRDELAAGTRLTQELPTGIRDAHTFVFMMSARSVESEWCIAELDAAIRLGRRIIPVLLDPTTVSPSQLEEYLRLEPADPGDAADVAAQLDHLLTHDLEWVRGHRRWSSEAARWDDDGRPRGLLLSGRRLELAESWRTGQTSRAQPHMTETLAEFLAASRENENKRQARQRIAISSIAAVLGIFGAGALVFGLIARDRAATAGSRELAAQANAMLPFDPAESRRLAERADSRKRTREAAAALQEAAIADRLVVATRAGGEPPAPVNVGAVAYTPDGRWLVTGGDDGRIRLWESATAQPRTEVQTDQEVRFLAVDRAGRRLLVGTTATVQLWDLACLTVRGGPRCRVEAGDREALVSVGTDTTAVADASANRVVTFAPGETTATIWQSRLRRGATLHLRSPVTAVAISDDGRRVATGTRAGRVAIWDANGRRLAAGPLHRLRVSALGFGPGGVLVSGSDDGTVRLWDPGASPANRLIGELPGQVQRLAVSRAGYVAAGGESGVIYTWELTTGRFVRALVGHTGIVSALRYGTDGRRLFSASDEGTLRAWESATGGSRAVMAGHRSRVQEIAISPRGDRVASVGSDGELRIWDVERDTSTAELVGHARAIPGIVYSRDGSRIVTASLDGTARVWDAISGREVRRVRARARLQAAAFGPGGSIVVADWNGVASRWDPGRREPTWRAPACARERCGKAYTLAVSADGRFVAAGSEHGAVLLNAATGERIRALHGDAFIVSLQFDAAGAHVLSAGRDGRAMLAPTRRRGDTVTLTDPGGALWEARLVPDGRTVLTAGDGGACVWTVDVVPRCARLGVPDNARNLYSGDVRAGPFRIVVAGASGTVFSFASSGAQPLRLDGHTGAIERVRLTADGSRIVSIGQDGVARVWDPVTGARVARFTGATTGLLDVAFDPTSHGVAVASNDGTARVYAWR